MDRPCLLTVHAHPDDESSKGAGSVARYRAEGIHTVLVCCTGGEEGDIVNPKMDRPEVRENLGNVRRAELAAATSIIGYDEVVMLGYRDSGMPDSDANRDPRSFASAPFDEAVGRLIAIIRRTRPQVIVTYGDDQEGYPHPDHLQVHAITLPAFARAGDPEVHPWAGPAWQPSKLYYSAWSRARIMATHEKMLEMGMESPFDKGWFDRPSHDHRITTQVNISDHMDVRRRALLAHATQIDPDSKWWFGLPPEVAKTVHPYDDYILAQSLVPTPAVGAGGEAGATEDDLFAGLRSSSLQ